MADVFLSYASEDRDRVLPLVRALESAGFSVWWDRRIDIGTSFDTEIERQLNSAACVVVLWSENSVGSEWVRNEASAGLERGVLVPVRIDQAKLPLAFHRLQTADLSAWDRDAAGLEALVARIRRLGGRPRSEDSGSAGGVLRQNRRPWQAFAALVVVAALVAGGWFWWADWHGTAQDPHTIPVAVLPFENTSGDAAQDYVGDAMSEEIWNRLSTLEPFRLIAMTSSRAAAGQGLDARAIAETLGVRYLVEGSVSRSGSEARVSVHLIDATDGGDVWSRRFEHDVAAMAGIFDLYDEISLGVASAFDVTFRAERLHRGNPQISAAAYNILEQAFYNFRVGLVDRVEPLVDRAIETDERYAPAHNFKGWWLRNETDQRLIRPAAKGYEQARRHVDRALQLDPELGSAHVQLGGLIRRMELDYPRAMRAYERAEALGVPLNRLASDKARLLLLAGRPEEALAVHELAAAQDPLFVPMRIEAVDILDELGRVDEARALIEELMALAPNDGRLVQKLANHAAIHGEYDRLRAIIEPLGTDSGWPHFLEAYIQLREGNPEGYQAATDWIVRQPVVDPHGAAFLYWDLQDYPHHLDWMDAAFEEGLLLDELVYRTRRTPGYWKTLEQWAVSDAAQSDRRRERVASHRARVEAVAGRMML